MTRGFPADNRVKRRLAPAAQRAFHLTLRLAVGDHTPLVLPLAPAGESELELRAPVLEVHPRRDERQAALAHLRVKGLDLVPVQEQLAVAARLVRESAAARRVLGDRRADEPRLPVADVDVRLAE